MMAQPAPAPDDDEEDTRPTTVRKMVDKNYSGWIGESAEGIWAPLDASPEEVMELAERIREIAKELQQKESSREDGDDSES